MEFPQHVPDDRRLYAMDAWLAIRASNRFDVGLKNAWWVMLELSYLTFRHPLWLNPAELATKADFSAKSALRYIRELWAEKLIYVHKEPDFKSRKPRATWWPCCLIDPFVEYEGQLRVINESPQLWLDLEAGDDRAGFDAAAPEGSWAADSSDGVSNPDLLPFKRLAHDAQSEAAATDGTKPDRTPSSADGNRSNGQAAPGHPPGGPAKLATTTPDLPPKPSRGSCFKTTLNPSPDRSTTGTRTEARIDSQCGKVGDKNAAPRGGDAKPIGSMLEQYAAALQVDPADRIVRIQQFAGSFAALVDTAVFQLNRLVACGVATAVIDGEVSTDEIAHILATRDGLAAAKQLRKPGGYVMKRLRTLFRKHQLECWSGRKLPR